MITSKIHPVNSSYTIKGSPLERVTTEHDLGIYVSDDLTWTKQVNEQAGRANKLFGYIKRNTGSIQDISLRRLMHLTLVLLLFGYASQIWAPQSVQLISACIERTQRRATKYILKLPFLSPISFRERLRSLKLLPITYWHEYLDMVIFFILTHGLVNVDSNTVPRIRSTGRNTRSCS